MIGLFISLTFIVTIYLYYINLASTHGYFLRQANQEDEKIWFQLEILKTKLLEYKQQNRETTYNSRRRNNQLIKVKTEIVSIPSSELTYNQQ